MFETVVLAIVLILIIIGTIFSMFCAIGIIRLPDVYTRIHATTKTATIGVLCTLVAAFLYFAFIERFISIRLLLGIFFVFLTAPVAGHLISRSAYQSDVPLTETTVQDELREALELQEKIEQSSE